MIESNDELIRWCIDNDCYDGDVDICDDCGQKVSRELSAIWAEELVICNNCKRDLSNQRRKTMRRYLSRQEVRSMGEADLLDLFACTTEQCSEALLLQERQPAAERAYYLLLEEINARGIYQLAVDAVCR